MFKCHVCGATAARDEFVSEVFTIDNRCVLVERIPAHVCERCGEPTFTHATTERVRKLVHGEGHPVGTVSMDIYEVA